MLGNIIGNMLAQRNGGAASLLQQRLQNPGAGFPGPSPSGSAGVSGNMMMSGMPGMPGMMGGGGSMMGAVGGGIGGLLGAFGGGGAGRLGPRMPQMIPDEAFQAWMQNPRLDMGQKPQPRGLADLIAMFMPRRMQDQPMDEPRTYGGLYQHMFR